MDLTEEAACKPLLFYWREAAGGILGTGDENRKETLKRTIRFRI